MKNLNFILLFLLVSGCSTFSKKQCRNFDWKNEGYQMALEGLTEQQTVELFRQKCEPVSYTHLTLPTILRV